MGGLRFRGKITENKKPDSGESGLAVGETALGLAVAQVISASPSSPSRLVPACAFDHRHGSDAGKKAAVGGINHGAISGPRHRLAQADFFVRTS